MIVHRHALSLTMFFWNSVYFIIHYLSLSIALQYFGIFTLLEGSYDMLVFSACDIWTRWDFGFQDGCFCTTIIYGWHIRKYFGNIYSVTVNDITTALLHFPDLIGHILLHDMHLPLEHVHSLIQSIYLPLVTVLQTRHLQIYLCLNVYDFLGNFIEFVFNFLWRWLG